MKNGHGLNERDLMTELADPVGVRKLFEDEDTKTELRKRASRIRKIRDELTALGYYEFWKPLRRVEKSILDVAAK